MLPSIIGGGGSRIHRMHYEGWSTVGVYSTYSNNTYEDESVA